MKRKIFKSFVTIEEAISELYKHFTPKPLGTKIVSLQDALGRVLASDIYSETDVPPYDRATMDGFAVIESDLIGADEDNPITLRKIGELKTGAVPSISVEPGTTIEISTGAMIPPGANSVVMVEYTESDGDNITFYRSTVIGENIQSAGSDIMMGELVYKRGTLITPRELGVLAAIGLDKITVFRKPKVAIISTGDEIFPLGVSLKPGKIYDINASIISGFVKESGCDPIFLGIAPDDADVILDRIKEGFEVADVVITSGSTSAGVKDVLYQLIDQLGNPGILVHGIRIRPGKPTIIGVVNGKPFFGLPGYPTSASMVFMQLFSPILRQMAGLSPTHVYKKINAKLSVRINSAPGRRNLIPVYLAKRPKIGYIAIPTKGESGAITTLAYADGFIIIPEDISFIDEGESVGVNLFSEHIILPDLTIMGSHCVGVDLLSSIIYSEKPDFNLRIINTGSMGGLVAIKKGNADIAGIHLFDGETRTYNIPFVQSYAVDEVAVLIRGYTRELGLVIKKGNPKGIKSVKDLLRPDVRFINRISGSGTRIFFDLLLKDLSVEEGESLNKIKSKINGYRIEAKTHNAIAAAVKHGRADVGIAIKPVAIRSNLDFIPLTKEHYDFLIHRDVLETEAIKTFIHYLKSDIFKRTLTKNYPGLIADDTIGSFLIK